MIEAAEAAEGIAHELRHMSRAEILDPLELVRRNGRLAGRLDEIATMIRRAVSPDARQVTPRTTRPSQRRREVCAAKGHRPVRVESRSA